MPGPQPGLLAGRGHHLLPRKAAAPKAPEPSRALGNAPQDRCFAALHQLLGGDGGGRGPPKPAPREPRPGQSGCRVGGTVGSDPPASSLAGLYHKEDLSNTVYYCSFINLHEAAGLTRAVKAMAVSGA